VISLTRMRKTPPGKKQKGCAICEDRGIGTWATAGSRGAGGCLKDVGFTLIPENGKALHAACLACSEGGEQQQEEGQHIGHGHPLTRFHSVLRGVLKSSFAAAAAAACSQVSNDTDAATPKFELKCGSIIEL
jgi:hypothetical protein